MHVQLDSGSAAPGEGAADRYIEVVKLAAPATASMLSYTLTGLVDTLMVGPLGAAALGGVGLSTALLFTVGAFLMGVVGAVSPLTARHEGAGDKRRAGSYVHQGVWVALTLGTTLGLTLSLGADLWIGLLSPGEAVAASASEYLAWRALGMPLVLTLVAYDHMLQGLGDTRTPMRIALVSNALNAALTLWFVHGGLGLPAMGVMGAAVSTITAWAFSVARYQWVLAALSRRDPAYALWPLKAPEWGPAREMIRIGLPMGIQFSVDVAAWLVMSTFIGWISDSALAASQIVGRLVGVPLMMAHGITVAATSLVGRHLGARRPDDALAYGWAAVLTGIVLTGLVAAPVAAWPELWIGLFSDDPAVIALGGMLLVVSVGLMMAETFANGAYGILQGAGDTRYTMKVTVGVTWAVGVPLAWALAFPAGLGANGVFAALGIQMATISALYLYRLKGAGWAERAMEGLGDVQLPAPVEAQEAPAIQMEADGPAAQLATGAG